MTYKAPKYSNIRQNITALRDRQGMSKEELAATLNCSVGVITAYEAGTRGPSQEVLEKLADVFAITTTQLHEVDFSQQTVKIRYESLLNRLNDQQLARLALSSNDPMLKELGKRLLNKGATKP